jgi:hypothetical protein
VETAVVKLKKYKLPSSDKITVDETLLGFTNSFILFGIRKSIVVPIYRKSDKTDCIVIMRCHSFQLHTKLYPVSFRVKSIY